MSIKINKYPNNFKSLLKLINSKPIYKQIYFSLNPIIFDTTLRDGLQNIKGKNIIRYSTSSKIEIYNNILKKYRPKYIEIGSLASEKYFPIFSDSLELYKKINNPFLNKNFILIPSSNKLEQAINYGCKNFSFITSVSNSFQILNTNKNILDNKKDIIDMYYKIISNPKIINPKIKIYISCIDYCPIEGKISNKFIIDELISYYNICNPNIICLSDTCASLSYDNFIDIIDNANKGGIPYSKFSLHLHIDNSNPDYYSNLEKIFIAAMDRKINHFDLSIFNTGGCSMTINSNKTKPNLSYKLYYKLLFNYIINKSKEYINN